MNEFWRIALRKYVLNAISYTVILYLAFYIVGENTPNAVVILCGLIGAILTTAINMVDHISKLKK